MTMILLGNVSKTGLLTLLFFTVILTFYFSLGMPFAIKGIPLGHDQFYSNAKRNLQLYDLLVMFSNGQSH
jgi:hypothetical protein